MSIHNPDNTMHIEKLAYLYPFSSVDPVRLVRAKELGLTVDNGELDESKMIQRATDLFIGHQAAKTYILGQDGPTTFDFGDREVIARSLELAEEGNIGLSVCTYVGTRNGKTYKELTATTNHIATQTRHTRFALTAVTQRPRVKFPVELGKDHIEDQGREYDMNAASARVFIDYAIPMLSHPQYVHIDGKPYISVINFKLKREDRQKALIEYLHELRAYAWEQYHTEIYLTGTLRDISDTPHWLRGGVDALTAYCMGPDFSKDGKVLQDYKKQMDLRIFEWDLLYEQLKDTNIQVHPSIPTGWDASSRANIPQEILGLPVHERENMLQGLEGKYPLAPIMNKTSAKLFGNYLRQAVDLIAARADPKRRQILNIFAFNEITEGGSFIPQLRDGEYNDSYLQEVKKY